MSPLVVIMPTAATSNAINGHKWTNPGMGDGIATTIIAPPHPPLQWLCGAIVVGGGRHMVTDFMGHFYIQDGYKGFN